MASCSCPGCDQPGINQCSACKSKNYCGPKCQTADWSNHKEECPGHLRKVGMTHLEKAKGFDRAKNWPQAVHHANLAATKLKQMKDRPIELIDKALRMKYNALNMISRESEALECAKEWYLLYPTNHTHPPAIEASFAVIESCGHNKEYFDALLYARTLWETITMSRDSHIPDNQRDYFTARGAMELARALLLFAKHGGMPAEEQMETGVEATMLTRRALEINTQLYGTESSEVASSMATLANVLAYFNDVDDDEIPRLYEQAIAIFARVEGSLSVNVASCKGNSGNHFKSQASKAEDVNDLDRCVATLELALSHFREAARIYHAINHVEMAEKTARQVFEGEQQLQQIVAKRATVSRG